MQKHVIISTKAAISIIVTTLCIGIAQHLVYERSPTIKTEVKTETVTEVQYQLPTNLLMYLTIEDLELDLSRNYSYISPTQRKIILESIVLTSKKYSIDPLILYAICAVESSFRFWLVHDKIKVLDHKNKPIETHAIGLGGVIYEIWEPQLKEAGILATRSDLYNPAINIEAIGLIYSELYKLPLKDKAYHPAQSALIRYFGGNYQTYFVKIDNVIVQLFREKFYKADK